MEELIPNLNILWFAIFSVFIKIEEIIMSKGDDSKYNNEVMTCKVFEITQLLNDQPEKDFLAAEVKRMNKHSIYLPFVKSIIGNHKIQDKEITIDRPTSFNYQCYINASVGSKKCKKKYKKSKLIKQPSTLNTIFRKTEITEIIKSTEQIIESEGIDKLQFLNKLVERMTGNRYKISESNESSTLPVSRTLLTA